MHPYPLIRSGGLFLMIVGAGIAAGILSPRHRWALFGSSLAVATLVTMLVAAGLAFPLGRPTLEQITALAGAVMAEVVVIGMVARRLRRRDERAFELGVLFVVGLHFLPMALAFGPLAGVLSVLSMFNAGTGLWLARGTRVLVFWTADGLLKMAFGALMFFCCTAPGVARVNSRGDS